jgi:2-polyprenyl-3-methyl-5-hydroxy-6-metoxy-1,4-benzoquinol methylase
VDRLAYLLEDQELMSRAKNYFAWQGRLVLPELGRRVVEVGCGIGNFTGALLDRELVVAVDNEESCIERLRKRYPERANLHAIVTKAETDEFAALARLEVDSCICLNVLEHIEDDTQALTRMRSILVPGGVIVLLVPAFQTLYGPIDENLGHYRRYDRPDISRLAKSVGLVVRKAHYVNLAGFFGWWVNSRILRREIQSSAQIEVFDRYIVPLVSRLEAIVPPPFGQSLFAVLVR